jgi:hypothetical protein
MDELLIWPLATISLIRCIVVSALARKMLPPSVAMIVRVPTIATVNLLGIYAPGVSPPTKF